MAKKNFADCVLPCEEDAPSTCNGKYVQENQCLEVQSGGKYLYGFTDDPCPVACDKGKCVTEIAPVTGSSCTESFEPVCFEGKAYTCESGKITETACGADEVCAIPYEKTTAECTTKCKFSEVGQSKGSCDTVKGKPVATTSVCRAGSTQMANYFWFTSTETCDKSCKDGICDSKLPTVGESCTDDDHDVCVNNALYYCHVEKHTWSVMVCGDSENQGYPLCRNLTETWADCVFECDEGDEDLNAVCTPRNGVNYAETTSCKKGLDGKFYYFEESIACDGKCKSGKCL